MNQIRVALVQLDFTAISCHDKVMPLMYNGQSTKRYVTAVKK